MIGELIKIWRWKKAYTIRQGARILGISSATLSRIENGKTMDSKTLLRLINWLCVK